MEKNMEVYRERCVVFYGGDSQVGTTMLALSAAELLAKRGNRVLFIEASGNSADVCLPAGAAVSLDDLRPALKEGNLHEEELRQTLVTERGVDILPGIRDGSSRDYGRDDLKTVCQLASDDYDWILVDGGSEPAGRAEGGLAEAALRSGGRAVLVLTQQEKCMERFCRKIAALEPFLPPDQLYVVNKFNRSGAFYTEKETAERLGSGPDTIRTIPFIPYGWQAEKDGITLLRYRAFRKAMKSVTDWIEEGETIGKRKSGRKIRRVLSALPHDRDGV